MTPAASDVSRFGESYKRAYAKKRVKVHILFQTEKDLT